MNDESAILKELRELNSSLADVSRTLPYSLPDEYFPTFEQNIKAIVADKENAVEDLLMGLGKKMPFSVPQGYFEQLPDSIIANVAGKKALDKEIPFDVPENYFTAFPDRVLQAAQSMDESKKRIPATRFVFKHIRLAAAAVLLLCIGLGAYTTIFNTDYRSSPEALLRSVPKTEIEAYLETSEKNEAEEIGAGNLSFESKDIVVYLNETGWE